MNMENFNMESENAQKQPGWDIARDIYETKQRIVDNRIRERALQVAFDKTNSNDELDATDVDDLLRDIDACQNEAVFLSARLRELEEQKRVADADKMWEELEAKHKQDVAEHSIQATADAMSEFDEGASEFFAPKPETPVTDIATPKKLSRVEKAQLRVDVAQKKLDAAVAALNNASQAAGPVDNKYTRIQIARAQRALAEINLKQYNESDGVRFMRAQQRFDDATAALNRAIDSAKIAGTPVKKYKRVERANAKKILAELYLKRCIEWVNNAKADAARAAQKQAETPAERAAREARYMQEMQAKFAQTFENGCRW